MKSVRVLVLAFFLALFARGRSGLYRRRGVHPGRSVRGRDWSNTKDVTCKHDQLCIFIVLVLSPGLTRRARCLM
jgi:hypothetical protein